MNIAARKSGASHSKSRVKTETGAVEPRLSCAEWRTGYRRYSVPDTRRFKAATG